MAGPRWWLSGRSSNSGYSLKVEPARFVDRMDVRYEMKITVKNDYFLK